ncbi:MAG TPA: hypothetical protein VGG27_19900 [Magnetospirillaceae bacterium]|jgi:hypothetical protein
MSLALEADDSNQPMTNVYNLLREACGISQAEAAEFVHGTRLDSVKSWCSDRRTAPQGVINDLQKLLREIQNAGVEYAALLKGTNRGDVYVIGLPSDEQDARSCGFPSVGAQMRAIAIAVSLLPEHSEIRMVERVRGAIPAPILEKEMIVPTEADSQVLISMQFTNDRCYTAGNVNRRKFQRLEDIGWVKGISTNISDVEYHLTETGKVQFELTRIAEAMENDFPDPAPTGFQTRVNSGLRRGPILKLKLGETYQIEDMSFRVEKIDGDFVTVKLPTGVTTTLRAAAILFSPKGLREG